MAEDLPNFKYHPDPVATVLVTSSTTQCRCCGQARGFIYRGPVYAREDLAEQLCPWCIADGSASAKLAAKFSDPQSLTSEGVNSNITDEVTQRTPGYLGWQQEIWRVHCNDACAYLGFPTQEELAGSLADAIPGLIEDLALTDDYGLSCAAPMSPAATNPRVRSVSTNSAACTAAPICSRAIQPEKSEAAPWSGPRKRRSAA